MIGATSTPTGTPASASSRTAANRREGGEARGSSCLARTWIERRDRQVNRCRLVPGEIGQEVFVAGDKMVLGDDHDRVAVLGEHLQARSGQAQFSLGGLVAVGHAAQGHHARLPAAVFQFAAQQFGCVLLDHDLGLEILPGAVAQELVRGPGVTVDAAVLATTVRVERGVEADVRAVVMREDGLCRVGEQLRQRAREFPARLFQCRVQRVAVGLVAQLGEPTVGIALGTPATGSRVHGSVF